MRRNIFQELEPMQPIILDPIPAMSIRDIILTSEKIEIKYHSLEARISVPSTSRVPEREIERTHGKLVPGSSRDIYIYKFPLAGEPDLNEGLTYREIVEEDLIGTPIESEVIFTWLKNSVISVDGSHVKPEIKRQLEEYTKKFDEKTLEKKGITDLTLEKIDDLLSTADRFYLSEKSVANEDKRMRQIFFNTNLFPLRECTRQVLIKYNLYDRAKEVFKRTRSTVKDISVFAPTPEAENDHLYRYLGSRGGYLVVLSGLHLGWRYPATVVKLEQRISVDGTRVAIAKLYAIKFGRSWRRKLVALP